MMTPDHNALLLTSALGAILLPAEAKLVSWMLFCADAVFIRELPYWLCLLGEALP